MRPRLSISAAQFRANIAAVQQRITPSGLLIVLKDDAYGHGREWAAREAQHAGVQWFGSYGVAEAASLREVLGATPRILAWAPADEAETETALRGGIDLGVGSLRQLGLTMATAARLRRPAQVHLKIDTGLHRNGIRDEDWAEAVREARAAEQAGTITVVGVWSHLAEASDAEDDAAQHAFHRALRVAADAGLRPEATHLTASAASWWRPELRGELCRIGAFCYGVRSADGPQLDGIAPIATLTATVIESGSFGARIGIGTSHGLPSTLAGMSAGTAHGAQRVSRIDFTSAELSEWTDARVGETVWLFGPGAHGESDSTALAESIDTVGEEILTRLTPRVQRVYEA